MLMFHAINAWRQQLPEPSRIHGIVRDGGAAPNIIPETASCEFYVRSPSNAFLKKMCKRFCDIAKGAALMTGTKVQIDDQDVPYAARKANKTLDGAFLEAAASAGLNPVQWETPGRASSDSGDVSLVVPAIHPYFAITKKKTNVPRHPPPPFFFLRASKNFRTCVAVRVLSKSFFSSHPLRATPTP